MASITGAPRLPDSPFLSFSVIVPVLVAVHLMVYGSPALTTSPPMGALIGFGEVTADTAVRRNAATAKADVKNFIFICCVCDIGKKFPVLFLFFFNFA